MHGYIIARLLIYIVSPDKVKPEQFFMGTNT